jgi:hypothetical protein
MGHDHTNFKRSKGLRKEFGIFNSSKNSNNTNLKDHPERMKYKRLPKPVLYRNEEEET